MTDHTEAGPDDSRDKSAEKCGKSVSSMRSSLFLKCDEQKNKTGTNSIDVPNARSQEQQEKDTDLQFDRVWREVVDFGEPVSGNGEEGWGRKWVSVARVSILDKPPEEP